MKKRFSIVSVLLITILLLTALPVSAAEGPSVYMDYRYSNPETGTIIEIPHISGGGKAVKSINAQLDIIKTIYEPYTDPKNSSPMWAEVLAYLCVTDRYINIVITCNEYPTYAYDGEMYTFVYDKKTGREFTLAEAMKSSNYTEATFANLFKDKVAEELRQNPHLNPKTKIVSCSPVGFRVRENGMIDFYLRTEVDYRLEANLRNHYIFRNGSIHPRSSGNDPDLLIKYSELEHMKPPLAAELDLLPAAK